MAKRLELVPVAKPLSEDDLIVEIGNGNTNVSELMRRSNRTRGVIRGMIRDYAPPEKINIPGRKKSKEVWVPPPPPAPPTRLVQFAKRIAPYANPMTAIGVTLAAGGIVLNYQYTSAFGGHNPVTCYLFGSVGIAIDLAAVTLLSTAAGHWDEERYWRWFFSIVAWLFCSGLSLLAGISFSASNVGDSFQARESVAQHRQALGAELTSLKTERTKITEDRNPAEIEELIQIARGQIPQKSLASSKDCTDVTISGVACIQVNQLRASKRIAEHRIEIDIQLRNLNEQIASLPPITVKDPGADYISRLTVGIVNPEGIEGFRVIGIAAMPTLAGLFLMLARKVNR